MKTKMKKKIKINALVILISFFCLSFSVKAASPANIADGQIKQLPEDTKTAGEAVLVATVNIYDAKIVEQKENNFKISFDLSNREKIQPDVKYAVQLIKQDGENQTIADEKVYSEIINLNENQIIKKEIEYTAPDYLKGEFQIWIIAKNQNGLTLASANPEKIVLSGDGQYVEIIPESCYLKIEGDVIDRKFTAMQGVDVKSEEKIIAYCDLINHSDNNMTVFPRVKTFRRTVFGSEIATNQLEIKEMVISPQEKAQISFVIQKPQNAQAYDARLEMVDNQDQIISNKVVFHYVLRGLSATIQNFRLDKNYYQKGEVAKVSFFWTGSADNFLNSRLSATDNSKMQVNINIKNADNQICASAKKELDRNLTTAEYDLLIGTDCQNPQVTVSIEDEKGNILDKNDFLIKSQNIVTSDSIQGWRNNIALLIILVAVFSSSLSGAVIVYKKRRSVVMLILILFGGIFLFGDKNASADTFSATIPPDVCSGGANRGIVTYTYNLDKAVYAPRENIKYTVSGSYTNCGNTALQGGFSASKFAAPVGDPARSYQEPYSFSDVNGTTSVNFVAEQTSGVYDFLSRAWLVRYTMDCDHNGTFETIVYPPGVDYIYFVRATGPRYTVSAPACAVSSWSPDPSTVCSGESFTQTSNCSTTQTAYGTKYCPPACSPNCNNASSYCSGTLFPDSCGNANACTGNAYCPPACVPNCDAKTNYCSGTLFPDSCGNANACTGTRSASSVCTSNPGVPCVSTPNTKICTCIGSGSCVQDCPDTPPTGPCNSGNWREVAP